MIILGTNSIKDTGFNVDNSCMFNSADSASMQKTAGTPTDNNKWTFSAWIKRSKLGTLQEILYGEANSTNYCTIRFNDTNDRLTFKNRPGSTTGELVTKRVFRDVTAWFHLVVVLDTSNATAANRDIIYINGVRETEFTLENHSGDGDVCYINSNGNPTKISKGNSASFFDGYMAEVNFIDGQALAADSFGEFDEDSGIWKPIDASGLTFGNNGFYLDFKDSANLGNDANGGTDLTETNLAATDQATDTCTNNFCTLNPLDASRLANTDNTFSQGNLKITDGSNYYLAAQSTFAVTAGKWYWEVKIDATTSNTASGVGVADLDGYTRDDGAANGAFGWIYAPDGDKRNAGTSSSYGDTYAANDIIGIALDMDNLAIYFSKNGTFQASGDPTSGASKTNAAYTNLTGTVAAHVYDGSSTQAHEFSCNFGSPFYAISSGNADGDGFGNFEHAVPSGYFSLNTKNLAEYG